MTRGIVIAGNESPLFSALCVEAAKRVETYAVVPIPQGLGSGGNNTARQDGDRQSARKLVLDWNPASPVSARTLALAAVNKMEHIDDAVLVCVPPAYRKRAEDILPAEIDTLVDYHIKGWFFLVRELAAVFRARQSGTLALVLPEISAGSRDDTPDLLGPVAAAAFRSFAQSVLVASLGDPYNVLGFSSAESGEENAFAAYIFKTMEEGKRNSGKWHKFGKFGLFGR